MLRTIFILSFLSTFPLYAQTTIPVDTSAYELVCLHPKERYITALGNVKGVVPHGEWILFDEFGGILARGEYKNGLRHGFWIFYDIDGCEMEKGHYYKGLKKGRWQVYEDMFVVFEEGIAIEQNVYK